MNSLMRALCAVVVVLLTSCGCHQTSNPESRLVAKINNSDIRWDGNYIGLQATVGGASLEILNQHTDEVIPSLMDTLEDKGRFIAAHVLLTKITGFENRVDPGLWNGLHVELHPDGQVIVPTGQQPIIIQRWKDWKNK